MSVDKHGHWNTGCPEKKLIIKIMLKGEHADKKDRSFLLTEKKRKK